MAIALLVYFVQGIAWPLTLGRDGSSYLLYYLEMGSNDPVNQLLMTLRTPIAPLLFGSSLRLGGPFVTEAVLAVLFCASVLCVYRLGLFWSRRVALISALFISFYPAYGALFHNISSEAPAAFLFILVSTVLFYTIQQPGHWRYFGLGILVFLLALARPSFVLFYILATSPFLAPITPIRHRVTYSAFFLLSAVPLLVLWCTYNLIRYDDFTLARTNAAQIPLLRAFTIARIVRSENGPASANLATQVKAHLLDKEPYRSYGIDLNTFFMKASNRMYWDLIPLSDTVYGWDTDYEMLRRVGLEAIRSYPVVYGKGVIKSMAGLLLRNPTQPAVKGNSIRQNATVKLNESGLPVPTEGDLIPRSYLWFGASSPEGKIIPDPNSIELKILDPVFQQRTVELSGRLGTLTNTLPVRDGSSRVARTLNFISILTPPAILFLIIGALACFLDPDPRFWVLVFICFISIGVLGYTVLGLPAIPIMRVPFDPVIFMVGIIGLRNILTFIHLRALFPWLP